MPVVGPARSALEVAIVFIILVVIVEALDTPSVDVLARVEVTVLVLFKVLASLVICGDGEYIIDFILLILIILIIVAVNDAHDIWGPVFACHLVVDPHEYLHVPPLQLEVVLAFVYLLQLQPAPGSLLKFLRLIWSYDA